MDGDCTPVGAVITPGNEHESRHIERLVDSAVVELPVSNRLLYDKVADSGPLRERLAEQNIDLICPHRASRVKPPTQDGGKLRRCRHRWRLERTNAWLHNYGRIVLRKDRLPVRFLGCVQHACQFTILKSF